MNPLFRKDIRENFRLALAALGIFTLIIIIAFRSSANLVHQVTAGQMSGPVDALQPLLSGGFTVGATFFCAIFGAALGWFQARNEAHRDLWAFLVHRPITRTEIFRDKTAAGLCLYFIGAGLPILGMIAFATLPGIVAAPFEPAMVLPAIAIFLSGLVHYFAGMLTALRQARWFGSRTFAVGAAVAASIAANVLPDFWQAALVSLPLAGCVAVAAWGAYQSGGFYRGQPRFGKFALTVSITCGSFLVLALLALLVETLFLRNDSYHWQNYTLARDGQIYVVTYHDGGQTVADLNGKPLLDPATGAPIKMKEFNTRIAPSLGAGTDRDEPHAYNNASSFFALWNVSSKNLWFLDRHGKLVGFSGPTRLHLGDLAPRNASGAEAFITRAVLYRYNYFNTYDPPTILSSPSAVYRVDLDDRKLQPIYTADPAEPITAFAHNSYFGRMLVLTRSTIRLVDMHGQTLLSLPYQPGPVSYPNIQASQLEDTNSFAIWFHPDARLNAESNWKLPNHIIWLSADNQVAQTRDLPVFHTPNVQTALEKIMNAFAPPVALILADHDSRSDYWFSLVPAALCCLVAGVLLRRYRFSPGAIAAWMVFIVLLGLPGLLTFVCAQELPKREACPACHKPRAVDREHCEHCNAAFAPPAKNGTEIFAPLSP